MDRMVELTKEGQLSPVAWVVYELMRRKFNGSNWDNISLTHSEVEGMFSSKTFVKAKIELWKAGIIKIVRQGRGQKVCSIFDISNNIAPLTGMNLNRDKFNKRKHTKQD
jgi:hypothetical protein